MCPLPTGQLWSRLNRPEDFALKQELYKNAITLIKNKEALLPLKCLDTLKIASLHFGADEINTFQTTLDKYTRVKHFVTPKNISEPIGDCRMTEDDPFPFQPGDEL